MSDTINKCPACGALRKATDIKCPECGYEFTNSKTSVIDSLNSEIRFLGMRSHRPDEYERALLAMIENFHIPQVKGEIYDLMLFLQPKALDDTAICASAWKRRQMEVIERAKLAFSEDSRDKKILETVLAYENALKAAEKKKEKNFWQKMPTWSKILSIVAVLFVILLLIPAKDISPEAYSVRFSKAVETEKWDKAMEHLQKCPEMGTMISDYYLTLIEGLIAEDRIMEAENLFAGVVNHVDPKFSKEHLAGTMHRFIDCFLAQGKMEYAKKYALELSGIVKVMKAYIAAGDEKGAMALYKANASKFSKYDYTKHKNVFLCDDVEVIGFLNKNGIKTE